MTPLFDLARARPLRLLCLGAHCDDIEIGCGATLLRWLEADPGVAVHWMVMTGGPTRHEEARRSARAFLGRAAEAKVELLDFRESFLPQQWGAVKEAFERVKGTFAPSVILTHARGDCHQDHRVVADLTWNTFRDHLVLEYEIPKYDGDLGQPNLFVPVTAAQAEGKVERILGAFPSQSGHAWFDARTFLGLMRLRGVECNASSGYAEAFHLRKMVV